MKKTFYNIDTSGKVPVVNIRGIIGGGFFEPGVTENEFIADVDALGEIQDLEVHISSKGGSVQVGLGIYNYLVKHSANIKTVVFSEASSIASVIAMAGNERVMLEGTSMFVHDPMGGAFGYASELLKISDYLETTKNNILDIYERVTGHARDVLSDLMKNETMMNAQEALRRGFATAIEAPETPVVNLMSNDEFQAMMNAEAEIISKNRKIDEMNAEIEALKNDSEKPFNEGYQKGLAEGAEIERKKIEGATNKKEEQEKKRASEIKAICTAARCPDVAQNFIDSGLSVEKVREDLFNLMTTGESEIVNASPVRIVENKTNKHQDGWKAAFAKASR